MQIGLHWDILAICVSVEYCLELKLFVQLWMPKHFIWSQIILFLLFSLCKFWENTSWIWSNWLLKLFSELPVNLIIYYPLISFLTHPCQHHRNSFFSQFTHSSLLHPSLRPCVLWCLLHGPRKRRCCWVKDRHNSLDKGGDMSVK